MDGIGNNFLDIYPISPATMNKQLKMDSNPGEIF